MSNTEVFEFTIESGKAERHYWMDLWRYRELFYILSWRDIAVQFKQTIMGVSYPIFVFAAIYFRKTEKTFADVI